MADRRVPENPRCEPCPYFLSSVQLCIAEWWQAYDIKCPFLFMDEDEILEKLMG